ncbi:GAF domain-containing protein [Georgenia sp. EYE_87]|uniref:helix-turn-helix domain-containing protein n=1 Tax=Georgenia sp. EYE_87 TaxID=2853448 RepID=UPI0020062C24|nr:GAF domain-containing protein [Georgenia sp. EYE_87]MCK6210237.1 GAF domain-containing protein [Georgenia sp. EYE_87]
MDRLVALRPKADAGAEDFMAEFLDLLTREARAVEFEGPVISARAAGLPPEVLVKIERAKNQALRVRASQRHRRRRERELSALFETVHDLAALKDVDDVLEAIVARVRQLLGSDAAYLTLRDAEHDVAYERVTDGILTPEFRAMRLPSGEGLGGAVASSGSPLWTDDYFADQRFTHPESVDAAVRSEGLTAILGVPMLLGRQVIGVLYAANRSPRAFSRDDVNLLVSLAAHASVAIDNARLLTETRSALADLKTTSTLLEHHIGGIEKASDAHDRLADLVLRGGSVHDVVHEIREVLGGRVHVLEPDGTELAGSPRSAPLTPEQIDEATRSITENQTLVDAGWCATPVRIGTEPSAALVLDRESPVDHVTRRILERAATVTALLLLIRRSVADTESRLRGDLLAELVMSDGTVDEARHDRARRLGVDLDAAHVVVVADLQGQRSQLHQAAERLVAAEHGLSTVLGRRLVVLLPGTDPRAAGKLVARALAPVAKDVTVGVAGPVSGTEELVRGHGEASRCVEVLLALGRGGDVSTVADLGFAGLLLGGAMKVDEFVGEQLGPVLEYDRKRGTKLVRTLQTYFARGQHVAQAAADLHVHPNTVGQRLERITRLLGPSWNEPERQLEIRLALALAPLLDRSRSADGR